MKARTGLSSLLLLLILTLVLSGFSCTSTEPWRNPGPRATFEEFLLLQMKGERTLAFDFIAPEDRAVLERDRVDARERIGEGVMLEPWQSLWIRRMDTPFQLSKIEKTDSLEERPNDGHRVSLRLIYRDGGEGEATMIWHEPRWYVYLALASPAQ